MAEEKKQSNNKLLIVIIILLLVVIIAGGIIAFLLISKDGNDNSSSELIKVNDDATVEILGNDSFLILDEDDAIPDKDELQKKIDDGRMNLKFSNEIIVENGKDGICDISNTNNNTRDMYVSIWLYDTQEEIYRSGLIPVGAKIEQLQLNRELEPGSYTGIMVYNQLEYDKIVAQVNVEVTLNVKS